MDKKFKTKSEYYKHLIEKENNIIMKYKNREKESNINQSELLDLKKNKDYMIGIRIEHEEKYLQYKNNDEPYYEPNTYEYYKNIFTKESMQSIDYRVICEIDWIIKEEDMKPVQKEKIIKSIFKAYKEINKIDLL